MYLKGMKIKQISKFPRLGCAHRLSIRTLVSRKSAHYSIAILFLNVLLYILYKTYILLYNFEAKKPSGKKTVLTECLLGSRPH